jgi:hypothetical protein
MRRGALIGCKYTLICIHIFYANTKPAASMGFDDNLPYGRDSGRAPVSPPPSPLEDNITLVPDMGHTGIPVSEVNATGLAPKNELRVGPSIVAILGRNEARCFIDRRWEGKVSYGSDV